MTRTVRQRLTELIDEEDGSIRELLWDIVKNEEVFRVNHEKSAKDKIGNLVFKAAEAQAKHGT